MSLAQSLPPGLPSPSQAPRVSVSGTLNTNSSSSGANGAAAHYGSASSYQTVGPSVQYSGKENEGFPSQHGYVGAVAGEISGNTASNVSGMVTGAGAGFAIAHGLQSGSVVAGASLPLSVLYDSAGNPIPERLVGESTGIVSLKVEGDSATAVTGNGSASVQGSALGSGYAYSDVYGELSFMPGVSSTYGGAYIDHNADVTNAVITGNGNVDGSYSTVNVQSYYNSQYEGSPGVTEHQKSVP